MKPAQKLEITKRLDDCIDHLVRVIQCNERCDDACELADVICKLRNIIKEVVNETPKK